MPKNNAKNEKKSEDRKSDKRNKPGTTEEERALGKIFNKYFADYYYYMLILSIIIFI